MRCNCRFLLPCALLSVCNSLVVIDVMLTVAMFTRTSSLLKDSGTARYASVGHADENVIVLLDNDFRNPVSTMDSALRAAVSEAGLPVLAVLSDPVRRAVLFDDAAGTQMFGTTYDELMPVVSCRPCFNGSSDRRHPKFPNHH